MKLNENLMTTVRNPLVDQSDALSCHVNLLRSVNAFIGTSIILFVCIRV